MIFKFILYHLFIYLIQFFLTLLCIDSILTNFSLSSFNSNVFLYSVFISSLILCSRSVIVSNWSLYVFCLAKNFLTISDASVISVAYFIFL